MLNMEGYKHNGSLGIASYCNGNCCICKGGDARTCIADTYSFEEATKEQIIDRLNKEKFTNYTDFMIKFLKERYNYTYVKVNILGKELGGTVLNI